MDQTLGQECRDQVDHIERMEEWNDQLIQELEEAKEKINFKDEELHNLNVELSQKIALLATGDLQKQLQNILITSQERASHFSNTFDRSRDFDTMSKFSANRSNTSQFYNRFNAGRNPTDTSYFTNSQTPNAQKEKSQFNFDGKSNDQISDPGASDNDVEDLSINNLSRDYVREQDPEMAFGSRQVGTPNLECEMLKNDEMDPNNRSYLTMHSQ